MFGIIAKLQGLIVNKYLRSIVRNALQFGFAALTGALTVVLTRYGAGADDISKLVNAILSLKEPLELIILTISGSATVAAMSLVNAKKSK